MLLPGESPWTEEPGGLQSAVAESDTAEQLSLFFPWWCLGRIHTVTAARLVTTVAPQAPLSLGFPRQEY